LAAAVELFCINDLLRFMHARVSSTVTLLMLFNPAVDVLGVSSVIATILAEKDINVVRHPSSTHSSYAAKYSQREQVNIIKELVGSTQEHF
jgi:hypothetical protein